MNDVTAYGTWLRATRKRLRISQGAVAENAGMHQTVISMVEAGQRRMDLGGAVKILAHFRTLEPGLKDPFDLPEAETAWQTLSGFSERTGIRI